jgi:hypothetical protein
LRIATSTALNTTITGEAAQHKLEIISSAVWRSLAYLLASKCHGLALKVSAQELM